VQKKQFRSDKQKAEFLNFTIILFLGNFVKFKKLATSQKCPKPCVKQQLALFIIYLLPLVRSQYHRKLQKLSPSSFSLSKATIQGLISVEKIKK